MKNSIFENLPIAIVAVLLSAATSFAVVSTKVSQLEKETEKAATTLEQVKDFKAEQRIVNENLKENMAEQRADLKELLKLMREK